MKSMVHYATVTMLFVIDAPTIMTSGAKNCSDPIGVYLFSRFRAEHVLLDALIAYLSTYGTSFFTISKIYASHTPLQKYYSTSMSSTWLTACRHDGAD